MQRPSATRCSRKWSTTRRPARLQQSSREYSPAHGDRRSRRNPHRPCRNALSPQSAGDQGRAAKAGTIPAIAAVVGGGGERCSRPFGVRSSPLSAESERVVDLIEGPPAAPLPHRRNVPRCPTVCVNDSTRRVSGRRPRQAPSCSCTPWLCRPPPSNDRVTAPLAEGRRFLTPNFPGYGDSTGPIGAEISAMPNRVAELSSTPWALDTVDLFGQRLRRLRRPGCWRSTHPARCGTRLILVGYRAPGPFQKTGEGAAPGHCSQKVTADRHWPPSSTPPCCGCSRPPISQPQPMVSPSAASPCPGRSDALLPMACGALVLLDHAATAGGDRPSGPSSWLRPSRDHTRQPDLSRALAEHPRRAPRSSFRRRRALARSVQARGRPRSVLTSFPDG